jgi:arylsulfatase A-like enzyme
LLEQRIVQGMGAGLVAGAAVGVVEVLVLVVMEMIWQHVAGLLYGVVVYGGLGLLGGLGLGLLRGLWQATIPGQEAEPSTDRSAWAAYGAALLFGLGLFLVVRNRVRHDVLHWIGLPWSWETLLLDGALLVVAGLGTAVMLWLLLRRLLRGDRTARIAQPRWNLAAYAIAVAAAALLSVAPALAASAAQPGPPTAGIPPDLRDAPNVILIVADTLRADALSCYGYTGNQTAHIDALARDGVLYRQMSAQASWTKPSVATMLTSLYPSSHRAIGPLDLLPDAVTTLPEVLRERGYRTAGFTTNVNMTPSSCNFQQGFDEYEFLAPDYPFFASQTSSRFAAYSLFYALRRLLVPPTNYPHNEYYQDAEVLGARARVWLEANEGTRFFLYLHYMDPHQPYYAHPYDGHTVGRAAPPEPDPAEAPALRQLYDGEITYLDAHLGQLFDQLKAWGLYDGALIILTADHGEEFQEHGGWHHGTTLYEEQLAVPLIVKYPANAHAGAVDTAFARSLDLAPTILDTAGVSIPEVMQGVSLRPGAVVARPESTFAEIDRYGQVLRAIRTRERKLIIANAGNPRGLPSEALFDLQTDPGEQRNLAQGEPDAVRLLRAQLDRAIAFAEALAVAGQTGTLDAATRERLRQLGY